MNQTVCSKKREALFAKMLPNSIAILPGARPSLRSNDTEYPFRQESNFYYLTHFSEAHAIALLHKTDHQTKYILLQSEKRDLSGAMDRRNHRTRQSDFRI